MIRVRRIVGKDGSLAVRVERVWFQLGTVEIIGEFSDEHIMQEPVIKALPAHQQRMLLLELALLGVIVDESK